MNAYSMLLVKKHNITNLWKELFIQMHKCIFYSRFYINYDMVTLMFNSKMGKHCTVEIWCFALDFELFQLDRFESNDKS